MDGASAPSLVRHYSTTAVSRATSAKARSAKARSAKARSAKARSAKARSAKARSAKARSASLTPIHSGQAGSYGVDRAEMTGSSARSTLVESMERG